MKLWIRGLRARAPTTSLEDHSLLNPACPMVLSDLDRPAPCSRIPAGEASRVASMTFVNFGAYVGFRRQAISWPVGGKVHECDPPNCIRVLCAPVRRPRAPRREPVHRVRRPLKQTRGTRRRRSVLRVIGLRAVSNPNSPADRPVGAVQVPAYAQPMKALILLAFVAPLSACQASENNYQAAAAEQAAPARRRPRRPRRRRAASRPHRVFVSKR